MKPMILCFFDRLGRFSSIFLASQFLSSVFRLLLIPESLETPRKGSSSSSPVPDHGDLMEFRVGNDMEDSFEVREDDIWVVSFPKTGTTLMLEMLWMIINNMVRCPGVQISVQ